MHTPGSTTAALLTVLIATHTSTFAATWQAKNRCSDAVRILRQNPPMLDLSKEIDPLRAKGMTGYWNQIIDGWNRASAQINQIPKPELDPQDPELAECFSVVQKWGAYIKTLDQKIHTATAAAADVEPFLDEVKFFKDSLWFLAGAHFSTADVFVNRKPADTARAMSELAKVEAACGARLPSAGANMPVLDRGNGSVRHFAGVNVSSTIERNSEAWCFVAKHRQELMEKALQQRHFATPGFGNWAVLAADAKRRFAHNETMTDIRVVLAIADPTALKKEMSADARAWYEAAGVTLGANPFPQLDAELAALRDAATTAAQTQRWEDRGFHAAGPEALGRAAVRRFEPHAKILASTMDAAGYTVETNLRGIPKDRFRSGRVLIARSGVSFCEERTFNVVEQYSGGGSFQSAHEAGLTEMTHLVRCP